MFFIRSNFAFLIYFLALLPMDTVADSLPPILDYYPNCNYKTLDTLSSKSPLKVKSKAATGLTDISVSRKIIGLEEKTAKMLLSLRQQAKDKDAEALILITRKLKESKMMNKYRVELFYKAELISNCNDLTPNKSKPAPITSRGVKAISKFSFANQMTLRTTISQKPSLNKRLVNDNYISFDNGIYGITLDTPITQVKENFGEPSVHITLSDSEVVLGYGRSHWFYFKHNQLVMIDSRSLILDQLSLNQIPARKSFDDKIWVINQSFESSDSGKLALGSEFNASKNMPQTTFKNEQALSLHWSIESDISAGKKFKKLSGFTLAKHDYKPQLTVDNKELQKNYLVINSAFQSLQESLTLDADHIDKELGKPLAKIVIKADEKIVIYNPYLYINYSNNEIREIHFSNNLIKYELVNRFALGVWQLGNLFDRQNLIDAIKHLPDDGFKIGENISFDADNYQLDVGIDSIDNHEIINGISFYIY